MGKGRTNRKCIQCGGKFEAKRSDARFCSANCRQKFTRSQPTVEEQVKKDFPAVLGNPEFHEAVMSEVKKKGIKIAPPSDTDGRKIVNPGAPRTKLQKEPEEGTNAYCMRYGAFYKKDIPK